MAGGLTSVPVRCLDATTELRVEQAIRGAKLLHVQNAGLGSAFNVVGSLCVVQGRVNTREVQSTASPGVGACVAAKPDCRSSGRRVRWGSPYEE